MSELLGAVALVIFTVALVTAGFSSSDNMKPNNTAVQKDAKTKRVNASELVALYHKNWLTESQLNDWCGEENVFEKWN